MESVALQQKKKRGLVLSCVAALRTVQGCIRNQLSYNERDAGGRKVIVSIGGNRRPPVGLRLAAQMLLAQASATSSPHASKAQAVWHVRGDAGSVTSL